MEMFTANKNYLFIIIKENSKIIRKIKNLSFFKTNKDYSIFLYVSRKILINVSLIIIFKYNT